MTLSTHARHYMDRRTQLTQYEAEVVNIMFRQLFASMEALALRAATDDTAAELEAALVHYLLDSRPPVTIFVGDKRLAVSQVGEFAGETTDDEAAMLHRLTDGRDALALAGYPELSVELCGNVWADLFVLAAAGYTFECVPVEYDTDGVPVFPPAALPYVRRFHLG